MRLKIALNAVKLSKFEAVN